MKSLHHETSKVIQDIVKITTHKVLVETGQLKPFISKNEAFRRYGRATVERWIDEGLVKLIKDGDKNCDCRIDRVQIETVSHTSNRASWYDKHAHE